MPDHDLETLTLDVVAFQERVGDIVIAPARLGSGDAREEIREFGADPDAVDDLVRTLAEPHMEASFIDVPPPAADSNPQGVYKIGEATITDDEVVVSSRFDDEVRGHGHLGKDNVDTAVLASEQ
jgi:hypothetical protein